MALTVDDRRQDPGVEALELDDLTGFLLRRAQQRHAAVWQREVAEDVSSVQFGVLNELRRNPGSSQRRLCDQLDLDRSTIADIVGRLERRGLIRRDRDAGDRRRNLLHLTDLGRDRFDALGPRVQQMDLVLTAGLSEERRTALRGCLAELLGTGPISGMQNPRAARVSAQ